jgi:hypothetical protein
VSVQIYSVAVQKYIKRNNEEKSTEPVPPSFQPLSPIIFPNRFKESIELSESERDRRGKKKKKRTLKSSTDVHMSLFNNGSTSTFGFNMNRDDFRRGR